MSVSAIIGLCLSGASGINSAPESLPEQTCRLLISDKVHCSSWALKAVSPCLRTSLRPSVVPFRKEQTQRLNST